MNIVKLIGNVGKEIQVKEFNGGKLVTFSLATNESYQNKSNETVKNTLWHTITVWGKVAEQCGELLSKGRFVSVEGRLNYRQYQNKDNQMVKVVEIVAFKVEEAPRKEA